jgi:kynurenine formamidase
MKTRKIGICFLVFLLGLVLTCSLAMAEEKFWETKWYPSKYGPDDTLGALNLITPEKTAQALSLIKNNKIYDLGMEYYDGFPAFPPRYWKSWILTHHLKKPYGKNQATFLEEVLNVCPGISTQIDGLGHAGIGDMYYNGNNYRDFAGTTELKKFGIEKIVPVITRGVMIDMAGCKGVEMLGPQEEISKDDMVACLEKEGMEIEPGDVVLFNTGWSKMIAKDPVVFATTEPGPGLDAGRYLIEKGAAFVGSDTWGMEVVPNPNPELVFPLHNLLLTMNGVYILENFDLAELAKDKVYEFCLILTAPKMRGMVQAILQPIAIN